jgi:UDP-3-O-[3-hydroxymyristoyl] glucosamine N-acyltransferase
MRPSIAQRVSKIMRTDALPRVHINPDGGKGPELDYRVTVGRGTYIDPSAVVFTGARIGDNVIIGPDSTIGADSRIGDGTHIAKDVVVWANAVVGNGATLGVGSQVMDWAKVPDNWVVEAGEMFLRERSSNQN